MCCIQKKRRVKYRFYINSNCTEKRGWFVGYGLELLETNDTSVSYTVAIIENDEMGVDMVPPGCITFIS